MLDTDVPRIRVDRLKEYIEDQKAKCGRQRDQSLEGDDTFEYHAECGKIEAYNEILVILDERAQRYTGE
jgi:hypothetical protein